MAHLLSSRSLLRSGVFYGRFGGRISGKTARLALALLLLLPAAAAALHGTIVDAEIDAPLALVPLRAYLAATPDHSQQTLSDSSGAFYLDLAPGRWMIEVQTMGYVPLEQTLEIGVDSLHVELRLQARPLLVDEMVVRTRRSQGGDGPAFVEIIELDQQQRPGVGLPELLDQATGVNVRRQGGLGSFSTVSIRGSTAEQVQIFLDGVPLNQALGGGVDLGSLPVGGVESVEVYRGAVPARFGGNSIGGVVNIRTQEAGQPQARAHAAAGSFGTRQLGAALGGTRGQWQYLGLADYEASANNFSFEDDNGTEYNLNDDGPAKRLNSDFGSLRALLKARRSWGQRLLQVHTTFDLAHRGIPGIGNNQSLSTRHDLWRDVAQAQLSGASGQTGYRLAVYHALEQSKYKDLAGEVGTGTQHERNTTRAWGGRGEVNALLWRQSLLTTFIDARREAFEPDDLLRPQSRLQPSRRHSGALGSEVEIPLLPRLRLNAGSQVEVLQDHLFVQSSSISGGQLPRQDHTAVLWGYRLGGRMTLAPGWVLQGHRGRYRRSPNFFELFGDRGAVIGNTELRSEGSDNWDLGLALQRGLVAAEAAFYYNTARDLIRFIQNSQRVSRPENVGGARLRGAELRLRGQLGAALQAHGSYTYQRAEDRSQFSYYRGNDLPNAPRHRANLRLTVARSVGSVHYEASRESRHFLDRANLRPVPRRVVHNVGGSLAVLEGAEITWEVRNLTANQVADLWGYPLPGRAFFVTLRQDIKTWSE